ncbi:MAG TPA: hypothetical protein VG940_06985, partial [Gemmatimonadales bacterium]|nr:hypothetical protein [Gemmatimonadales bacterium]
MRLHILLAFTVLATPLAAQQRAIAPAASVLFAAMPPEVAQDTVAVDDGMPQGQGAFLGILGGAGIGYLLATAMAGSDDGCTTLAAGGGGCGGSDPAKTRLGMAVAGGFVGLFVGSSLAGPHPPRPTFVPTTHADSLRLARRKGGRVGALVGGLIAGVVTFAMAAQGGKEPVCDAGYPSTCQGGDGFDGVPVLLATGAGALTGYLLGR